jgi:serine/threonine protein kinase
MTDQKKSSTEWRPNGSNGPSSPAQQSNATKMIGDYVVGKTLGQGTFAKVKLGVHKTTKQKVALKLIDQSKAKSQKDKENITREIKLLSLLDHPNIVKLFEVIQLPEKNTTCLVLEFVEGGELFDYIVANKRIREPEAINFFRQIISALEYCHSNLVIHRGNYFGN